VVSPVAWLVALMVACPRAGRAELLVALLVAWAAGSTAEWTVVQPAALMVA
jgi:hypothetical protein